MAAAVPFLPYILAGGGALAQIVSADDAADERRQILNAQLERDDQASKKSNQLVLDQAQKLSGQQRADELAKQEDKIYQQQQKDLMTGAGGGALGTVQTSGDAGNVSDDFVRAKAERAVTEGNRLTNLAREVAKTRAPGQLLTNEGYQQADLAGALSNIGSTNQNYARAAQADASNVNEGPLGSFGKIASAIGLGLAAGGIGAPVAGGAGASAGGTGISFGGNGAGFKVPSSLWG